MRKIKVGIVLVKRSDAITSNQFGSLPSRLRDANSRHSSFTVDLLLAELNIWQHSYFLSGLVQLAKEGTIALRVMSGDNLRRCSTMRNSLYPLLTFKCAEAYRSNSQVICFDPKDQSDAWQTNAHGECDVYYKRSIY